MVDKIETPDPRTVVFRLKFPTSAFLPALADPYTWIYKKEILDKDPRWYEKNILGSGPFKFVEYQAGQSIKGERNPHYYHEGLPYLDGVTGIYADKQAVRVEAIRGDRAAIGSRPPQKPSSSSSRHKLSANQHPPHWRGRHNRSSFSRNRTIEASGSNPSQRSCGNSDSGRGCSAPSSRIAIDLRQASSCESLISPRYSSGRCTTRPPPIRRFSTMLQ
jgi:MarR-like DNA-binding transcriptional regulator SgrR of sgrS sRNA